jgi:ribose transport system substrate-binding protein
MVGGWALFTKTLLTDLDPKKVKLVAVDALPTELPYVEKGLAPCCSRSRRICGATSASPRSSTRSSTRRTSRDRLDGSGARHRETLGSWARQLRQWGFPDVPRNT